MSPLDSLTKYFEKFPGTGARQARRFVFHVLTLPEKELQTFSDLIKNIRTNVLTCPACFRFHTPHHGDMRCTICRSETRDQSKLTIVERDNDIDAIERSGMYDGVYFVLGGTVPLLDSQETKGLRGTALKQYVTAKGAILKEVILAFSINPDGENTGRYIEILLKDILQQYSLKISHLGRGLSTGSELEYADPETIKNAFRNRG